MSIETPDPNCPICGDAYGPRARICRPCAADPANVDWREREKDVELLSADPTPPFDGLPPWKPTPLEERVLTHLAAGQSLRITARAVGCSVAAVRKIADSVFCASGR